MTCERVKKLLPFLQDGSLAPDIAREAGEHVERCESCRADLAELSRTIQLVQQGLKVRTPIVPPVAYREAVMRKIRKRKQERSIVSWAVPVAASLFLIASISSYTFFHRGFRAPRQTTNPSTAITSPVSTSGYAASLDEQEIIRALYNYVDISLYDVVTHLDENEWAAAMDLEGIYEE